MRMVTINGALQSYRSFVQINERGLVKQCIERRHVWTRGVTGLAKLNFIRMRGKNNIK
jgi:hypothetical protein